MRRGVGIARLDCLSPPILTVATFRSSLLVGLRWEWGLGGLSTCLLQWSCEIFPCRCDDCSLCKFCFSMCVCMSLHMSRWCSGSNHTGSPPPTLILACMLPTFSLDFLTKSFATVLQYRLCIKMSVLCTSNITYIFFQVENTTWPLSDPIIYCANQEILPYPDPIPYPHYPTHTHICLYQLP